MSFYLNNKKKELILFKVKVWTDSNFQSLNHPLTGQLLCNLDDMLYDVLTQGYKLFYNNIISPEFKQANDLIKNHNKEYLHGPNEMWNIDLTPDIGKISWNNEGLDVPGNGTIISISEALELREKVFNKSPNEPFIIVPLGLVNYEKDNEKNKNLFKEQFMDK